jgi:HK97 family phage prohead protease
MQREIRISTELRTSGDEFALVGYAARHNVLSHNLGGFREIIRPGAFTRSLKEKADVKCLLNHAPDNILGRTKSGTLTLGQDDHGLHFRCQLDRTNSDHQNIHSACLRGDIDECSFAFTVAKGGQDWADGKDPDTGEDCLMRSLTNVDLLDVSCVTYPAYPSTSVAARYFPDGDVKEIRSAIEAFSKKIVLPATKVVIPAKQTRAAEPSDTRLVVVEFLYDVPSQPKYRRGRRDAISRADAIDFIARGWAKLVL